jgi:hypothetical protein
MSVQIPQNQYSKVGQINTAGQAGCPSHEGTTVILLHGGGGSVEFLIFAVTLCTWNVQRSLIYWLKNF